MVNLPVPLTSLVATSAKVSSIFLHTAGFNSVAVASAAAMPDLDIAAPTLMPAFIARGAIARLKWLSRDAAGARRRLGQ